MNQGLAEGLRVAKSRIDGKGCFAAFSFSRNQKIAEYVGERISFAEAERRQRNPGKKCIFDVNTQWSVDGSRGGNGTQHINHSCDPNAYPVVSRGRIFFYALREIAPGEEITADYLYELEMDQKRCRCGVSLCLAKHRKTPVINPI
jgi:SET domain-containing protein